MCTIRFEKHWSIPLLFSDQNVSQPNYIYTTTYYKFSTIKWSKASITYFLFSFYYLLWNKFHKSASIVAFITFISIYSLHTHKMSWAFAWCWVCISITAIVDIENISFLCQGSQEYVQTDFKMACSRSRHTEKCTATFPCGWRSLSLEEQAGVCPLWGVTLAKEVACVSAQQHMLRMWSRMWGSCRKWVW